MGIFGWDLPPGCRVSDLPGYDDEAVSLDDYVPARAAGQAIWWDADGDVVIDHEVVGHVEWDDQLADEANYERAGDVAQRYLEANRGHG